MIRAFSVDDKGSLSQISDFGGGFCRHEVFLAGVLAFFAGSNGIDK